MEGQRFGNLVVLKRYGINNHRNILWLCQCDCGEETIVSTPLLTRGSTSSCGCFRKKKASNLNKKHGKYKHPLYSVWSGMRSRCNNKNHDKYHLWGGRGIKVCKEWEDFEVFLSDVGERPEGTSLDRIDNDGDYRPGNVRWATAQEQADNRRSNKNWIRGRV